MSATIVAPDTGKVMPEDAQQRATEFVKELYAAGDIDAGRFDSSVSGILAATTETELAELSGRCRRP
jgi:uncharacterized membrane protein